MKCKAHPYERGGGVCATCLRDRLLALAAAQNESSLPLPIPASPPAGAVAEAAFPRSVSPYVGRRKSDASGSAASRHHHGLLFFRTPQVGPSAVAEDGAIGGGGFGFERRRSRKFSVLATLFGHSRSEGEGANESKARSWLAGIMPRGRRRRKEARANASTPPPRRSCRVTNRGLSPERDACEDYGEEESSSAAESPWRPTASPMRNASASRRRHGGGGGGGGGGGSGVSGFAVCLSPLVRPCPSRQLRGQAPDLGFAGEIRPRSPLAPAASLGHCRSRKLADVGRFR